MSWDRQQQVMTLLDKQILTGQVPQVVGLALGCVTALLNADAAEDLAEAMRLEDYAHKLAHSCAGSDWDAYRDWIRGLTSV